VTVNLTTGLLGHLVSSRRYKEEIKPMDKASEALYRLNPVTYRYKKEIDPTQSPAFGLIAEEVAQVNPELVACNAAGQPESVHYEMVNAMLLNEFLKEHRKVEEQQAAIAEQREQFEARLQQQDAKIQRVKDRIELTNPAPRIAASDR
jgi:predicted ribosome quality control (RQC) complex YloA/Tae2 family protein